MITFVGAKQSEQRNANNKRFQRISSQALDTTDTSGRFDLLLSSDRAVALLPPDGASPSQSSPSFSLCPRLQGRIDADSDSRDLELASISSDACATGAPCFSASKTFRDSLSELGSDEDDIPRLCTLSRPPSFGTVILPILLRRAASRYSSRQAVLAWALAPRPEKCRASFDSPHPRCRIPDGGEGLRRARAILSPRATGWGRRRKKRVGPRGPHWEGGGGGGRGTHQSNDPTMAPCRGWVVPVLLASHAAFCSPRFAPPTFSSSESSDNATSVKAGSPFPSSSGPGESNLKGCYLANPVAGPAPVAELAAFPDA